MAAPVSLPPLFPRLSLWIDPHPRSASANMAADELLLGAALPHALLRAYRWEEPACSFGYFQRWNTIQPLLPPGAAAVRRWTGGGLVDHRSDLTYSIVLPLSEPWSRASSPGIYRAVHERLAAALQSAGVPCHLAPTEAHPPDAAGRCFAGGHARHDVLGPGGKIAGAAQRRHRHGLLHQGSLSAPGLSADFWQHFATALATEVLPWVPPADLDERIAILASSRYGSPSWLHLR